MILRPGICVHKDEEKSVRLQIAMSTCVWEARKEKFVLLPSFTKGPKGCENVEKSIILKNESEEHNKVCLLDVGKKVRWRTVDFPYFFQKLIPIVIQIMNNFQFSLAVF